MTPPDATARPGADHADRPRPHIGQQAHAPNRTPWAPGQLHPPAPAAPGPRAAAHPAAPSAAGPVPAVPATALFPAIGRFPGTIHPTGAAPAPVSVRYRAPAAALTGLTLLALLGGWLVAAPFLVGGQPRGGAWTDATRVDVATGAVLAGAALAGLFGYFAAAVCWLARYGR